MVCRCVVKGCNNSSSGIVKSHVFPKDLETFNRWTTAVGKILDHGKRQNYVVCDIHFSDDSKFIVDVKNRTNLKFGAVPTLFLNTSEICTENIRCKPQSFPEVTAGSSLDSSFVVDNIVHYIDNTALDGNIIGDDEIPVLPCTPLKKPSLLGLVNVSRVSKLSPKAKKLYNVAAGLNKKLHCLKKKNKENIKRAINFSNSETFKNVKNTTAKFLISQLKMQKRSSHGRRYTLDDKVLALSLMKQSASGYRLLKKIFALPSRTTLLNLLRKLNFKTGINNTILQSLKDSVKKLPELDCHCSVIFDEMSVDPSLHFNTKTDCIEGFEDVGDYQKTKFANRAMVFMARGIRRKWKQPVAYYFTEGAMSKFQLKTELSKIIRVLQDIGLHVSCTVSDQAQVNTSAIKSLHQDTDAEYARKGIENKLFGYLIGGKEIVHIYDPPHLLKCVRNNFVEGNANFKSLSGETLMASWSDIVNIYEFNVGDYDTRMINKLTDSHVYKEKLKKMKVKLAAQVFSQRVSATIRGVAKIGLQTLSPNALGTADFLLFFDKLFDSVNGTSIKPSQGKYLRCAVSSNSLHHDFWVKALNVLSTINFKKGTRTHIPPTIRNWTFTIKAFRYLWKQKQKQGFKFLSLRNINQDSLENFFGSIRSHGARNVNPTCHFFTISFASLIVTNLMSSHSPDANCEKDDSVGSLSALKGFLKSESVSNDKKESNVMPIPPHPILHLTCKQFQKKIKQLI